MQALDRMAHVDEVINDPDYKFEFPGPDDRPGAPIIIFSDASFAYPGGSTLFRNLNFGIDLDSRAAMVGPNGIGKSTILKLISGELQPSSGTVFRSAKVYPGMPEQKLRGHLGSFGITGNLALQPMHTMSGGQKSRVAFSKITFKKPHILLFDELSNHLDLGAVEALIQGLVLFQEGVLMVSHGKHLISGSVEQLWVVSEGRITPFNGIFETMESDVSHKHRQTRSSISSPAVVQKLERDTTKNQLSTGKVCSKNCLETVVSDVSQKRRQIRYGVPEQKLRGHLGSFGLTGNLALQPMYTLSGGQKSRVAFSKITFKKPHILLLDESSNHIDLDAVEALIQGLVLFQGGVLMSTSSAVMQTVGVDTTEKQLSTGKNVQDSELMAAFKEKSWLLFKM